MSRRDEQLFPDPATRVVWAGACALDEASQHDLLRELGRRLAFPNERAPMNTREVREARAIAALREAAEELGRSPSVNEYRHLRKTAHPEWPPDGSIRDWLSGGWNEVLKQAHLEAVPDDAPIVVEGEHAYTKAEIIAALRECAQELGRNPTFNNYLNWARSPEVRKRPGRRPRSQNVFERNFGGYPPALVAAGLAGADGTGVPMSTLQRSGRNYRWSDGELMAALAEAIDYYEGRFPTCGEYTRYRELRLEESADKDAPPRIPAMNGYQRRFGGWGKTHAFYWEWLEAVHDQEKQEVGGAGAGTSAGGDSGGGSSASGSSASGSGGGRA